MKYFIALFLTCVITSYTFAQKNQYRNTRIESKADSSSYKPHWSYSTKSEVGEKWYVRSEPERKNAYMMTIWVKANLDTASAGSETFANVEYKALVTFDFSAKQFSKDRIVLSKNGMEVFNSTYDEWEDIVPDTVFETIFKQLRVIYGYKKY